LLVAQASAKPAAPSRVAALPDANIISAIATDAPFDLPSDVKPDVKPGWPASHRIVKNGMSHLAHGMIQQTFVT